MKLVWLSDIHLDIAYSGASNTFIELTLGDDRVNGAIVTGDISNGQSLRQHLTELGSVFDVVYVVLGNHDYYHRSIRSVREGMAWLQWENPRIVWLPDSDGIRFANGAVLLGHDGWADGTAGNGIIDSPARLNDEVLIEEQAACADRGELATLVKALADEGTAYLKNRLQRLGEDVHNVIVATHVPPFEEAALYQGKQTDDDYLPHFTNPGLGEMLIEHIKEHPGRKITVLSGHTHHQSFLQPHPQIDVHVAHAEYRDPKAAGIVRIDESSEVHVETTGR